MQYVLGAGHAGLETVPSAGKMCVHAGVSTHCRQTAILTAIYCCACC